MSKIWSSNSCFFAIRKSACNNFVVKSSRYIIAMKIVVVVEAFGKE